MGDMADYLREQSLLFGDWEDEINELEYKISRQNNFDRFYRGNNGELKMMKTKQIYYVGHKRMRQPNDWGKTTKQAAINHAKQLCRDTGEPQIVVKIIAYIEPEVIPIKVTRIE